MTTFALIHGAWHGAWCWEPLIPELERRGHRAVAVDLPCDDPAATTMDDAQQVTDALADATPVPMMTSSWSAIPSAGSSPRWSPCSAPSARCPQASAPEDVQRLAR